MTMKKEKRTFTITRGNSGLGYQCAKNIDGIAFTISGIFHLVFNWRILKSYFKKM